MRKSVTIKPMAKKPAPAADDWVLNRAGPDPETEAPAAPVEKMKRLTIDVPLSLHSRMKAACALRETKMADVVRDLLEREFPVAKS